MSQLLVRFSKIFPRKIQCPRNNALIHQSLGLFSSSATSPYLALGPRIKEDLGYGRSMGDVLLYDPAKEELVTNLQLPFRSLDSSNLAYSERDHCFYLPSPGGNYLFKWDFNFKEEESPMCRKLVFRDLPELQPSEYQMLASCSRAEHWVESSSSGESFLVQWYSFVSPLLRRDPVFMVFREEETTEGSYMCYTEDIGDLCIFLSDSHPFCVKASSCTGLDPNSIYLMSLEDFDVYNLATRTCRRMQPPDIGSKGEPIPVPFLPFWIPPLSI